MINVRAKASVNNILLIPLTFIIWPIKITTTEMEYIYIYRGKNPDIYQHYKHWQSYIKIKS